MALHRTDQPAAAPPTAFKQAPSAAPHPMRTLLHHSISSLFTILVIGILIFYRQRPDPPAIVLHPPPTLAPTATPFPTATPGPITVYVSGAVQQPALYTLPPGSRIGDALALAGGLLPEADTARINQAEFLFDGAQIFAPTLVAGQPAAAPGALAAGISNPPLTVGALLSNAPSSSSGLVNINTATLEELMSLPGIGQTKAESIVAGRPYASIEELERVSGIGPSTVEKLRAYVAVQ